MGFYIEVPHNHNKARQLIELHGAEPFTGETFADVPAGKTLVCVVQNAMFDAAGICYDQREFEDFQWRPDDPRPRDFLLLDTDTVIELQPRVAELLTPKP